MLTTMPGPPGYPIVGNILDVLDEVPINALASLADKYGPIFRLRLRGKETIVVSSCKLVEESCDETRFRKAVSDSLDDGKSLVGHALFTSPSEKDPDWGQTHRVLAPAFRPLLMNDMFGDE